MGGARRRDGALVLVYFRCIQRGRGGRAAGIRFPHPDGGITLLRPAWPFFDVETAAGLLEGGRAQANLARSVFELEMEEALEHLLVDADVARQRTRLRIFAFLLARKEQERSVPFRHVRQSAVVRRVKVEEIGKGCYGNAVTRRKRELDIGGKEACRTEGSVRMNRETVPALEKKNSEQGKLYPLPKAFFCQGRFHSLC